MLETAGLSIVREVEMPMVHEGSDLEPQREAIVSSERVCREQKTAEEAPSNESPLCDD